MHEILAAIPTTDQVDAWAAIVDRVIQHLGDLAIVAIVVWTKVEARGISERLNRQGQKIDEALLAIPPAAAAPPAAAPAAAAQASPAAPVPVTVRLDHNALATQIAAKLSSSKATPAWPTPSEALPAKVQQ